MTEQVTQMGERAPKIYVRSGLGKRQGLNIDPFLGEEDRIVLHERWKDDWPEKLAHRGGEFTIRCDSVLEVGYSKLSKVYGIKRAKKFIEVAEQNIVTR